MNQPQQPEETILKVQMQTKEDAVELLTRAARAIGDEKVLWVRLLDGTRRKARVVLGDWMGGTPDRPWPDVALIGTEPSDKEAEVGGGANEAPTEIHREITSVPPEAWQGTEPAEGTRRYLILEALRRTALSVKPNHSTAIRFADAVESALLDYGADRDDSWVQKVVMAAITAGQEIDIPFPADTCDAVLREFGCRPSFPRDWPTRGKAAISTTDDSPEPPGEDGRPPDDFDLVDAARRELMRRIEDGRMANQGLIFLVRRLGR